MHGSTSAAVAREDLVTRIDDVHIRDHHEIFLCPRYPLSRAIVVTLLGRILEVFRASLRPRPATHKRVTKNGTARDRQLRDHHVALSLVRLVLISSAPHRLRKWDRVRCPPHPDRARFRPRGDGPGTAECDDAGSAGLGSSSSSRPPKRHNSSASRPCVVSSTFSMFAFGMVDEPCGLATGDICHFTTREPASAQKVGHRCDRAVRRLGFHCHPHKYVTGVVDGTCTGIDLHHSQYVGPRLDLSCPVSTSPVNLAATLGVCQWFDLLVLVSVERFYSARGRPQRMFQMFLVLASVLPQLVPIKFGVWRGCVSNAPQTFQSWCFIPPKNQSAVELARCCLISQSSFLFCWMPQPFLELLPQGDRQPQFLECSKSCSLAIGRCGSSVSESCTKTTVS